MNRVCENSNFSLFGASCAFGVGIAIISRKAFYFSKTASVILGAAPPIAVALASLCAERQANYDKDIEKLINNLSNVAKDLNSEGRVEYIRLVKLAKIRSPDYDGSLIEFYNKQGEWEELSESIWTNAYMRKGIKKFREVPPSNELKEPLYYDVRRQRDGATSKVLAKEVIGQFKERYSDFSNIELTPNEDGSIRLSGIQLPQYLELYGDLRNEHDKVQNCPAQAVRIGAFFVMRYYVLPYSKLPERIRPSSDSSGVVPVVTDGSFNPPL